MRTPRSFGLVATACLALGLGVGIGGAAVSDHIAASRDRAYRISTQQWDASSTYDDRVTASAPPTASSERIRRPKSDRNDTSDGTGTTQARKRGLWVKWVTYFATCGCSWPASHNAPRHADEWSDETPSHESNGYVAVLASSSSSGTPPAVTPAPAATGTDPPSVTQDQPEARRTPGKEHDGPDENEASSHARAKRPPRSDAPSVVSDFRIDFSDTPWVAGDAYVDAALPDDNTTEPGRHRGTDELEALGSRHAHRQIGADGGHAPRHEHTADQRTDRVERHPDGDTVGLTELRGTHLVIRGARMSP